MEIYAVYNGRQAVFNQKLNEQLPAGSPTINFITLQVIFDETSDTFAYDEYKKFVLFNVNTKDIQAMFPYKSVEVTGSPEGAIVSTLFKVILNDNASGYFIKTKIIDLVANKKGFDFSKKQKMTVFSQAAFSAFLTAEGADETTFACSVSKTGGPCY